MSQHESSESLNLERLNTRINTLEKRIASLETQFHSEKWNQPATLPETGKSFMSEEPLVEVDNSLIESRIGEYGLGWLGSLVLFFGIVFLMAFTLKHGYPLLSAAIGYIATAGVFLLTPFLKKSFTHLGFILTIIGNLLLYYVTMRLYFFSPQPLLANKTIIISLLLVVTGVQLFFSIRKNSELISGIAIVLILVTAILSDTAGAAMTLVTVSVAVSIVFLWLFNWWRLLLVSLFLAYLCHLLWLFNNPFLGHPFQAVATQSYSVFYLFSVGMLFSLTPLIKKNDQESVSWINAVILSNAICFSIVMFPITVIFFPDHYVGMFGAISVFCILYSVLLQRITKSSFTPSFFACFGFFALSVSVYGLEHLPNSYFFLALQSFLVVSMALWFRSRIIVVMNLVLFIVILLLYIVGSPSVDRINFCFAFVAFATARILNWKKERLTLKTDLMRNFYLFTLFFTMLYACYHAFPGIYITLSWAGVAVLYFILGITLKNIKYRWMSVATLLVTVIYLFLVDLAHLEVGYRVVSFLVLAIILFAASLYYTKYLRKKRSQSVDETSEN